MRALLDTQIFILLARLGVEGLSARARKLVEDEDNDLLLSSVSIVEIATKASIKKLAINASAASKAAEDLRLTLIPFEARYAMRLFDLPLHHRDPFDRILIAQSLEENAPIVSADPVLQNYSAKILW